MIEAHSSFAALAARLVRRADALARARAESATPNPRDDARHWRDSRLVWPLFGQG